MTALSAIHQARYQCGAGMAKASVQFIISVKRYGLWETAISNPS